MHDSGKQFPLLAAAFEGSLIALALGLGWLLGIRPLASLHFCWHDTAFAAATTVPLLVLLWACLKSSWEPLRAIQVILKESIVPLFRGCSLLQLAIIALLAGLGEELLFRGVVQTALDAWIGGVQGHWIALAMAAGLFGMLHSITTTYAVLTGIIGLYLGWLWMESGNLMVPVLVHALYDFLALACLV